MIDIIVVDQPQIRWSGTVGVVRDGETVGGESRHGMPDGDMINSSGRSWSDTRKGEGEEGEGEGEEEDERKKGSSYEGQNSGTKRNPGH